MGRQGDPGKVIRKLVHGPHPELEVGRFLTTDAHFDAAPATLGWVELAQGEETVTLSVLQQFVPNEATAGAGCWNDCSAQPVPSDHALREVTALGSGRSATGPRKCTAPSPRLVKATPCF